MNLAIKRALVTGGSGFLGSAIIGQLRDRGVAVKSFARGIQTGPRLEGVEYLSGDVGDFDSLNKAMGGSVDVVFHTAARAGLWGPYDAFFSANVTGTENVIKTCREHGISRLVYTSSPSVVSTGHDLEGVDETQPIPLKHNAYYPATKASAEKLVLAANGPILNTVALRPHLIWGPGDNHIVPRIIRRARAGKLRLIGGGRKRVDTIYVDNAAEAHLQAADLLAPNSALAGKAYFLSNDEPMPLVEIINGILKAAGLPPEERSVPMPVAYAAGAVMEAVYGLLGISHEPAMTRFLAHELGSAHWFNIAAAKRDLNYRPSVNMAEGFLRLGKWLRTNPKL